jgi:uncharacterized protein YjbI with pentapeptide repeats
MAESRIDPFDVGALERAVNDSAGRVSGIWLSFVVFSAYLAAAASMITHRQIFLEEPIKLPTINIDLPLTASAILLPTVFVIYHVFVLLQVVLLARTANTYNEAIEHNVTDEADRTRLRQRLANTLFAQLFAGSSRERQGAFGWLLGSMAWITMAIAPVGVLIVFEIKFLPYHNAWVTWTHRSLIAFDLLAVLVLWASAVQPHQDIGWRSLVRFPRMTSVAAAVFILSNFLITYPGEPGRSWMKMVFTPDPLSNVMAECQISKEIEARFTPSFDRLVLLGEDFVDDARYDKIVDVAKTNGQKLYESERIRILRGRDLRCARLAGADLRLSDFSEADLSGAILRGARLDGSRFVGAEIAGAVLDRAQLQRSSFSPAAASGLRRPQISSLSSTVTPPAPQDGMTKQLPPAELPNSSLKGAQLEEAFLDQVNLERADLTLAQLEKASLAEANLRGTALIGAGLGNAKLDDARLQGASLENAWLAGTSLVRAKMQGALLRNTGLLGADLESATMHGAIFEETRLQGTTFYRVQLQGALFQNARFEGTLFVEAQLQGVQVRQQDHKTGSFRPGALRDSIVSGSFLWRAGSMRCDFTHVASPNFEPIIEARYSGEKPIAATDREISEFIKRSLEDVPDKSNAAVRFSKAGLQADLISRLSVPASATSASIEQAWQNCARESEARKSDEDFQKLADNIVDYACRLYDMNPFASAFATKGNSGRLNMWSSELEQVPVGKLVAKSLLDEQKCRRTESLTASTKQSLRYVISPGE